MAVHILRQTWTTIIFVVIMALNVIAYFFPDTPYIGVLANPLTAMAAYIVALNILFMPAMKWLSGRGAFLVTTASVFLSYGIVWWWYLKP